MNEYSPDFAAAESYLRQARDAYIREDQVQFIAARQMVLIALGLLMVPSFGEKSHVNHPCG